jgi:hypothetical protein
MCKLQKFVTFGKIGTWYHSMAGSGSPLAMHSRRRPLELEKVALKEDKSIHLLCDFLFPRLPLDIGIWILRAILNLTPGLDHLFCMISRNMYSMVTFNYQSCPFKNLSSWVGNA